MTNDLHKTSRLHQRLALSLYCFTLLLDQLTSYIHIQDKSFLYGLFVTNSVTCQARLKPSSLTPLCIFGPNTGDAMWAFTSYAYAAT